MILLLMLLILWFQVAVFSLVPISLPLVFIVALQPLLKNSQFFGILLLFVYFELVISPRATLAVLVTILLLCGYFVARKLLWSRLDRTVVEGVLVQGVYVIGMIVLPLREYRQLFAGIGLVLISIVFAGVLQKLMNLMIFIPGEFDAP